MDLGRPGYWPGSGVSLANPLSSAALITLARSSGIGMTLCQNLHDSLHRPRSEKVVQSLGPPILISEYFRPAFLTNDAMSIDGCSRLNFWTTVAQSAGIAIIIAPMGDHKQSSRRRAIIDIHGADGRPLHPRPSKRAAPVTMPTSVPDGT
jgi:hypothetical protein